MLKKLPESGRILPELSNIHIRELIEGNYRIVYRYLNQDLVEILTIHHSARDMETSIIIASIE